MQIVAYLNFNNQCREAFEFYRKVLGGELVAMVTHADMGIPASGDAESQILHARLVVGDQTLMGSDTLSDMGAMPNPVQVSLSPDSVDEAERIFAAFAEDGIVMMPLEEQPWAARFGFLADRFGIPWMINYEGETGSRR